ncbi:AEC family transporter [Conexibacter sp. CPCC 206217]|uniref:AEC family transporter n=1 Tax=Conexibacter sp. CPCC 206217 TaxID=3064574 RepID=UPI00271E556D|nr:AEC family transporter [Conexibacter sp. CPCC 206217]MDO8213872.1 transporter [Conexibacter sp. CPCC 206217]
MIPVVVTVVLALMIGVWLERRLGGVKGRRVRIRIAKVMLYVLLPFVSYVSIARLHLTANVGIGVALALALLSVMGIVMWRVGRGPLRLDRPSTGAAMVCTIQANTGFFGLPLCAALFSQADFTQAVAYDVLVSMPAFVFGSYTIGALFGTHGVGKQMGRHVATTLLKNPVLYAVALAAVVPESLAPEALVTPSKLAVYALLPLGFIVVGMTLSDEADEGAFRFPPPLTRAVAVAVTLRMAIMPLIVLTVSLFIVRLPVTYPLLAAMPAGVNTVLVAHQTGLNLRLAADGIAWSTAIAVVATLAVAIALAIGLL